MVLRQEIARDMETCEANAYGVNLRYRYNDDYTTTVSVKEDGQDVVKVVPQTIQILGESNSTKIKNDMNQIASILKYSGGEVTNEELLSLTVDDLSFEELDEEIFIDLMQKALSGEPHKEGRYSYIPSYALLSEKEFLNGYKFQIGFINTMGCLDVIVIDVLYRTGSGYDDYIQLSDIVDKGEATQEQVALNHLIENISSGILQNNNFLYKEGDVQEIANVDISRLYVFLENIEKNEYYQYVVSVGE